MRGGGVEQGTKGSSNMGVRGSKNSRRSRPRQTSRAASAATVEFHSSTLHSNTLQSGARSARSAPGPGETRMPRGFMAAISSTVLASLGNTTYSQPRSPRYCKG